MGEADDNQHTNASWARAVRFSSVGIEFGLGAGLGVLLGWWLDSRLGTSPLFLLVLLFIGLGAGFASMIHRLREMQQTTDKRDDQQDEDSAT